MKISSVNNVYSRNNGQNFGMAVKITPAAQEFIQENLSPKEVRIFSNLVDSQKNNLVNINLYFSEMYHLSNSDVIYKGISAVVKDKKFFSENYKPIIPIFKRNPIIKMLEASIKYADKKARIAKNLQIPM